MPARACTAMPTLGTEQGQQATQKRRLTATTTTAMPKPAPAANTRVENPRAKTLPLSNIKPGAENQPNAGFTVAWQPQKKVSNDPKQKTADSRAAPLSPQPWQRARAEAARRIKEAEMIAPGDITRRVESDLTKKQSALKDAQKQLAKEPANEELQKKEQLLQLDVDTATKKLDAIVNAEEQKKEHLTKEDTEISFDGPDSVWAGLLKPIPKLEVTYETCMRSLRSRGSLDQQKTLQNPNWIHFPKYDLFFGCRQGGHC